MEYLFVMFSQIQLNDYLKISLKRKILMKMVGVMSKLQQKGSFIRKMEIEYPYASKRRKYFNRGSLTTNCARGELNLYLS